MLIADRLKQFMPTGPESLVVKIKGWLKPKYIAELAASFEESLDSGRQEVARWSYRGATSRGQSYRAKLNSSLV